ncbi:hypothetical protein [Luedemannella helvata]|uniref:Uncharacterized protein n=1 Tax=Luedemannella helvata TaxID=349315 RepID=A0ABP4X8A0_9ACTN
MGRHLMISPALRVRRALVCQVLTRRGAVALVAVATVIVAGVLLPTGVEA